MRRAERRRRRGGQTGETFRPSSIEASPYRARASRPPLRGGECDLFHCIHRQTGQHFRIKVRRFLRHDIAFEGNVA